MEGTLYVKVLNGEKLAKKDANGKSDPYCLLWVGNKPIEPCKTEIKKKTLNPEWKQSFEFVNVTSDVLKVRMWDWDSIGKDDFMGKLNIDLAPFFDNPFVEEEIVLPLQMSKKRKSKVKGSLSLKIEFRSNLWRASSPLNAARVGYTYETSGDLHMIIGGANNDEALDDCEVLDISTLTWRRDYRMNRNRMYHASTVLPDGRIFVCGGTTTNARSPSPTATCETFDPETQVWSAFPDMWDPKFRHTANALPDGRIIVIGGNSSDRVLNSAEIYDPQTNEWSRLQLPYGKIMSHKSETCINGDVVVVGGTTAIAPESYSKIVFGFSFANNTFYELESAPSIYLQHNLLRLENDDIVLFPGSDWHDEEIPSRNQKLFNNVHRIKSSDLQYEKMGRVTSCSNACVFGNIILSFGGKTKEEIVSKCQYFIIPDNHIIDTTASTWKTFQPPITPRVNPTPIIIDSQTILLLGGISTDNTPTDLVDLLTIPHEFLSKLFII